MRTLISLLLAFAALPAFAHPGNHHGDLAALLWHLVSEPDHLAMLLLAVLVGAGAAIALRRKTGNKTKP